VGRTWRCRAREDAGAEAGAGGGIKGFTYFLLTLPAAAVVKRTQSPCGQLCGTVKVRGTFRLRCAFPVLKRHG
jgi:hypothetical protein